MNVFDIAIDTSPIDTFLLYSPTVQPASNIPHQTADSGVEYAMTTKVTTPKQQPPTEEYAMVDKSKKHATATQGVSH